MQVLVATFFHKIKHQVWERSLTLSYQSQSEVLQYSLLCVSGPAKGSIASCMACPFLETRQCAVINCITECEDEQSCAQCSRHLSLEQRDRPSLFRGLLIISEQFFSWSFCWNFTCSSLHARGTWEPTGGFAPCLHGKSAARHAVCRAVRRPGRTFKVTSNCRCRL